MKNLCLRTRTASALFFVLVSTFLLTGKASAADPLDTGPLTLIISYHTTPANKLALTRMMQESGLRQFDGWKKEGILQSYRVLVNRHIDSDNWDVLALLSFAKYADVERWKKVEQTSPAGLSMKALAVTTAIHSAPADLMRQNSPGITAPNSVFLVIPYDYLVSLPDYLKYVDGYLVPQVDGWREEGVLANYGLYVPRYGAARPWSAMLLLEYKDHQSFGLRNATTNKVRARLQNNAEWKAISDNKAKVRTELQPVVADEIRLK